MEVTPIKLKQRAVGPHKAVMKPVFNARTVLTNSPWTFVALWLKRNKKPKALFYWEQARQFYKASEGLDDRSAPLLLYYCFMNAAKALLVAKGVSFNEGHGVTAHTATPGAPRTFANEAVKIKNQGILPSLATYYGESEQSKIHTLQQLLFNMVFIHRTYCLTFRSQTEMFLPLAKGGYVYDPIAKEVFFKAEVVDNFPLSALKKLPASFVAGANIGERTIRSVATMRWLRPGRPTPSNIEQLADFNQRLRREVHYIKGVETLWYLRLVVPGPTVIQRQLPTMILAAMHRLSEICRYHPLQLAALLDGQKNWLLSEFIQMSAVQYIDEIASEMTGYQFLVPNVRSAS